MLDLVKEVRLHTREDDKEWERVVFAEVLIPETPNTYADYWTHEGIKDAAYTFMINGFGIDRDHDHVDLSDRVHVVESFIAREGDGDFIVGSWVVAMKIMDDDLWNAVLNNEINGYSYEALNEFFSAVLTVEDDFIRVGITEPDSDDDHTHAFMVMVDEDNRVVSGGTEETHGHFHTISTHTITDEADGHTHRYNLVSGKDGK